MNNISKDTMGNQPENMPRLPARADESHKGSYGRALLIGGSRGMTGAIAMAGMSTLRSGAGLATLAVPDVCLECVAALNPCYTTIPLPCDREGRLVEDGQEQLIGLAEKATAVALGPGLGRSDDMDRLVRVLYTTVSVPMVCDADALNALARHADGLSSAGGPRVMTPHPGEFNRLTGGVAATPEERERLAHALALNHGIVMVLKGHRTLVSDGTRCERNQTGNPGMATGGAGDVLTGVITALLCQGLSPWEAARLGVHVHGMAGDCAASRLSMVAMTAADILDCLPAAWQRFQSRDAVPA